MLTTFPGLLVLLLWIAALIALVMLLSRVVLMRRGSDRLGRLGGEPEKDVLSYEDKDAGPFRRWLYLAGYRARTAPLVFFLAAAVFFLFGMLVAWLLINTGPIDFLIATLAGGGNPIAEILIPLILVLPYLLFLAVAAIPWIVVRAARKSRVALIEQDMPVVLEILAALTEAGLNFDTAVDRLMRSHRRNRPLSIELGTYRADVEAGRKRSDALRRLGERVDIMTFSTFVSAVVLAEQTGGSLARVLRDQAEYIRVRRRERAMAKALALPAKLVVPTVLFFVPAILVLALGPVYFNFLSVMNSILNNGSF